MLFNEIAAQAEIDYRRDQLTRIYPKKRSTRSKATTRPLRRFGTRVPRLRKVWSA